ncbi:hypothetical protein [Rhodoferax sp.]|nr:hypothetical protein [Rhodoferax sp.]
MKLLLSQFEIKAVSLDYEAFKSSIQDTFESGQPPASWDEFLAV